LLSAKAPGPVKNVLSRLALLPGPNAAAALMPPPRAPQPTPVAATPPAQSPTPSVAAAKNEPDVKTVSLDSLPVLAAEPAAPKVAAAAAVVPVMHTRPAVTRDEPKPVAKPSRESARETAKVEKAEKPEPVAKAEPKPKPEPKAKAEPPPPGNESFLKAAIRSAIAADAAKTK
jgi:hypothetical protein